MSHRLLNEYHSEVLMFTYNPICTLIAIRIDRRILFVCIG